MVEINDIINAFSSKNNISKDAELDDYHCIEDEEFGTSVYLIKGGYCITVPFVKDTENKKSKCLRIWWRKLSHMEERSSVVCEALKNSCLDYFIDYKYLKSAIYINGKSIPGIRMDWVDEPTITLSHFLLDSNPTQQQLQMLANNFYKMCEDMNRKGFAHGDLSSSNILVNPEDASLFLIDYDSMYVPDMGSKFKQEIVGTDGYQHAQRYSNPNLLASSNNDFFSQQVIYVQLLSFAKNPELCKQIAKGHHLLLNKYDLDNPENFQSSFPFGLMKALNDPNILFYLEELKKAISQPLEKVKSVCDLKPQPTFVPEHPKPKDTKSVFVETPKPKEGTTHKTDDGKYQSETPKPSPAPKDIPGEYCAYCKFKIADGYPDAKFCPNCGKTRVTYRLPQK